jgi:uncharacterized protein YjeT (DUF2065 family)
LERFRERRNRSVHVDGMEVQESVRTFFCLLGLLLIVEGLPYFAFPDRMKHWMSMIQGMEDAHLRVAGFVAMAIGLVIVYAFRV